MFARVFMVFAIGLALDATAGSLPVPIVSTLNEDFLSPQESAQSAALIAKVREDVAQINSMLGSLAVSAKLIVDFGSKLEQSGADAEKGYVLAGAMDAFGDGAEVKFRAVIAHEWGHISFSPHLYRKLSKEVKIAKGDLISLLDPYNELYGDIIAALHTRDPRVLYSVIGSVNAREANSNAIAVRDFTAHPDYRAWNHEPSSYSNAYMMFDPARGSMWKMYMNGIAEKDRGTFLRAYLSAARAHVLMRIQRKETPDQLHPASQLNQEFVKLLIEEATKSGLKMISPCSECE